MLPAPNFVTGFRAAVVFARWRRCRRGDCRIANAARPVGIARHDHGRRQAAPAETSRECLSQQDIDHPTRTLPKPAADCSLTNIEQRQPHDLRHGVQAGAVRQPGRMELVLGSTSYDGMADMKISAPGKKDTPMTVDGQRQADRRLPEVGGGARRHRVQSTVGIAGSM